MSIFCKLTSNKWLEISVNDNCNIQKIKRVGIYWFNVLNEHLFLAEDCPHIDATVVRFGHIWAPDAKIWVTALWYLSQWNAPTHDFFATGYLETNSSRIHCWKRGNWLVSRGKGGGSGRAWINDQWIMSIKDLDKADVNIPPVSKNQNFNFVWTECTFFVAYWWHAINITNSDSFPKFQVIEI